MSEILLYDDEGVYQLGLKTISNWLRSFDLIKSFDIKSVGSKYIKNESWEDEAKLIIFPGGSDVPYHQLLRGEGCRKIRTFVQNGGSYLGICAGAYFGCSEVEFALKTDFEVRQSRELGFFPGTAVGPIFKPFCYRSEKGASAARVCSKDCGEFYSYYNGGCMFSQIQADSTEVLATYQEREDAPAVVLCRVGTGKAILSGIHIEYSSDAGFLDNSEEVQEIQKLLKESEQNRRRFGELILGRLL